MFIFNNIHYITAYKATAAATDDIRPDAESAVDGGADGFGHVYFQTAKLSSSYDPLQLPALSVLDMHLLRLLSFPLGSVQLNPQQIEPPEQSDGDESQASGYYVVSGCP